MDIKSTSRKYLGILFLELLAILIYIEYDRFIIGYIAALVIIPGLSKHRGFSHSLIWLFIITAFAYYKFNMLAYSIPIGYITHLILDKHFKLI